MHFKLADLKNDYEILLKAKEDSENFIKSNDYKKYDYYGEIIDKLNISS